APANAWMAYGLRDVITLRQFVQQTDADEQFKRIAHHKLDAMLGLCERISCRRQALLAYFGETLSEPCGNCDNCIRPPETWDGTVAAQKAISCVYRTGQRFGVSYIVDVLVGKKDERIHQNRHDELSVFGLGLEHSAAEWRGIFRQLIAQGHLDVDMEGHGALKLAAQCRSLLRGEMRLNLRKLALPEKNKQTSGGQPQVLQVGDAALFEALRALRRQLAKEQGVPPYVIFHDASLHEMARARPSNVEQMRHISGVGEQKLNRYGSRFVEEIVKYL
ncbi:MAG: RQC domain-containing protein, partial [Burkholderiales bacterium]